MTCAGNYCRCWGTATIVYMSWCALVDRPMNLVSYHLGKLRGFELVSERRSSADGRDVYYSLDLERTRTLLQDAGLHLHPSFWMAAGAPVDVQTAGDGSPVRVLFLCTRNSARSQMAEGLLRHMSDDGIHSFSAGDYPTAVHPFAVRAMREVGIDISHQQAKHKDHLRRSGVRLCHHGL